MPRYLSSRIRIRCGPIPAMLVHKCCARRYNFSQQLQPRLSRIPRRKVRQLRQRSVRIYCSQFEPIVNSRRYQCLAHVHTTGEYLLTHKSTAPPSSVLRGYSSVDMSDVRLQLVRFCLDGTVSMIISTPQGTLTIPRHPRPQLRQLC